MGFEKRREQVINEKLSTIPRKQDPFVSLFTQQEHIAKKRGKHFDHRLIFGDKAFSFVNDTGLPKKPGDSTHMIRTPDHKANYALWSGRIKEGEIGEPPEGFEGKNVLVRDVEPMVVKLDKNKIDFRIYRGPNEGKYVLINMGKPNIWKVIRREELPEFYAERVKFSGKTPSSVWTDPRYIAEKKLHGAMYYSIFGPKGISFISRRKTKDGKMIHREENVPHLRDIKVPKRVWGTVLAGEMTHPKGFSFLSGLMNSAPDRAVETQRIFGKASYNPFELVKYRQRKPEIIPYGQRRKIISDIVKVLQTKYMKQPEAVIKYKKEFYKRITNAGAEGVVLKNLDKGYGKDTWYRETPIVYYDAKIVGFEPGGGKYKDKAIGVVLVEDREGKRFKIGTGFTDDLRIDMYKNPKQYIGKLVKIKKRKNIPAPVFSMDGFTVDKSVPDIIPAYTDKSFRDRLLGGGVPLENISRIKYAILNKMRLRKKAGFLPPVVKIYTNSFLREIKKIEV